VLTCDRIYILQKMQKRILNKLYIVKLLHLFLHINIIKVFYKILLVY